LANTLRERFEAKVGPEIEGGCRLWMGAIHTKSGYGGISSNGEGQYAHRVAWELARGPIPKGLCVLHRCDVPRCVAVAHLFLGSQAENMRDKSAKGRHSNGREKRSHCPKGHPLSGENLLASKDGHRRCKACHRAVQARYDRVNRQKDR
jgi:hypothetical protein